MKKLSMIAPLMLALAGLFFSGCATVTRGTKDTLVVESDPAGADVRLSTGQVGKTPTSFKLSRGDSLTVTISKEGYETVNVNVTPQIVGAGAAGMAGNVLVGGLIGAGVDAWSGAMKDLKPNPVRVTMVKLASAEPPKAVVMEKSLTDKLKELKAALDAGLITKEEYDRERAKLMGADTHAQTAVAAQDSAPPAKTEEAKPQSATPAEAPAAKVVQETGPTPKP